MYKNQVRPLKRGIIIEFHGLNEVTMINDNENEAKNEK